MTRLFADVLVMSDAYVAARFRAMRESGLVARGARGPFAPEMTALGAARLLIAVMGAQSISETAAITTLLGSAVCVMSEGVDDCLAETLYDLCFEQAVAVLLEACLDHRLGRPEDFERLARGVTISLSPTNLTAAISRDGFAASFQAQPCKAPLAGADTDPDPVACERLWLRSNRIGLQTLVSIEAPELLELAPAFGPADGVYIATN